MAQGAGHQPGLTGKPSPPLRPYEQVRGLDGREAHRGAALHHPQPPLPLTMAGDDIHINHGTPQLLEHLDHGALARGNAPCQAHQEHLPRETTDREGEQSPEQGTLSHLGWARRERQQDLRVGGEQGRPDQCWDRDAKEGKGDTAWPGSQS